MRRRTIALVLFCSAFVLRSAAQDLVLYGTIPAIQVDGKLNGEVDYFFQFGSEIYAWEHTGGITDNNVEMRTLDLTTGINFNPGPDWNLAFSFQARRRSPLADRPGAEIRPWQQVTYSARFGKYRLRNRLRAEQRFIQPEQGDDFGFDLRLRYRVSVDFPLEGERLDDKELYLNSSMEWLVTPTENRSFYYSNPRVYTGLGYRFTATSKLETGAEFRTQNRSSDGSDRHIFFWRLIWVKTI